LADAERAFPLEITERRKAMPIFMDRHDMRDATAEHVAEAHRRDLEIQDKYGVKYMTYWFDEARGAGFCLVDAPDAATAERVHREAHGEIPSDIIPVDLATVEAFLGRISDPRTHRGGVEPSTDTGLRAVLVTDIVGSTEMTVRLGDASALELVRVHDALVRRGLASHDGREVKHTGDGIMAAFDEVSNAVRAAADIQQRFYHYNTEASERLYIRIGVHAGEPVTEHNDLFGATVQMAFRLCGEAEAEGILVSGLVRQLAGQDTSRFIALGERRLKGFAAGTVIFRFEWRNWPHHATHNSSAAQPASALGQQITRTTNLIS
jgi:class 3 adenylate cyclase